MKTEAQFSHLQEPVFPHPDGRPHRKACAVCAFRRNNPQALTEDDFDWMYQQRDFGGFTFYCAHRDEDGHARECACWAAINAGRQAYDAARKGDGGSYAA